MERRAPQSPCAPGADLTPGILGLRRRGAAVTSCDASFTLFLSSGLLLLRTGRGAARKLRVNWTYPGASCRRRSSRLTQSSRGGTLLLLHEFFCFFVCFFRQADQDTRTCDPEAAFLSFPSNPGGGSGRVELVRTPREPAAIFLLLSSLWLISSTF